MKFLEFGSKDNKVIVLIHGLQTPWQILSETIDFFSSKYRVVVPVLSAHEEDRMTEFVSVVEEARQIESYLTDNCMSNIFAVCGFSLGGVMHLNYGKEAN